VGLFDDVYSKKRPSFCRYCGKPLTENVVATDPTYDPFTGAVATQETRFLLLECRERDCRDRFRTQWSFIKDRWVAR
jgi:hypothetical protein